MRGTMWTSYPVLFACLSTTAFAIGQKSNINFDGKGLELASSGSSVQIWCEYDDWPAVLRVCDDLALDFGRVTGTNGSVRILSNGTKPALNASMIYNITGRSTFAMTMNSTNLGGSIIAGTVGSSSVIDNLVKKGKIDVSAVEGKWEAYTTSLVDSPMDGVSQALVIAGKFNILLIYSRRCDSNYCQDPTAEALCTAYTVSLSKLASRRGTTLQILHRKSTPTSTPRTQQLCKAHLRSNIAASSSTTRLQL